MDPLSAAGLVSSIFQFIQFGNHVLHIAKQVRQSAHGAPQTFCHGKAFVDIGLAHVQMLAIYQRARQMPLTQQDQLLDSIHQASSKTAEELLDILNRLSSHSGRGGMRSFMGAFHIIFHERNIDRLQKRLANHLDEIDRLKLHYIYGEMPAWSDAVHRAELVLSANIKDAQAAVQTQLEAQKDELLESLRKQQSANVSKMMLPPMLPPSLQAEIATQNARIYKTMQSILQSQTETRNLLRHGGIITQVQQFSFTERILHKCTVFARRLCGSKGLDTNRFLADHASMLKWDYRFIPTEACAWLVKTNSFNNWKSSRTSKHSVLALTGGRGTGKFLATSYITNFLLQKEPNTVILHYCKFSWVTHDLTPKMVLECVLSQILQGRPAVFARNINSSKGRDWYWTLFEKAKQSREYTALMDIFADLVSCMPKVYLIIDGMDTCQDRAAFLAELLALSRRNALWIVISDQFDADVVDIYAGVNRIEIKPGDISCDLSTYVSLQLQEHFPGRQYMHRDLHSKIVNGANDQLGWARHILSCLASAEDDDDKFERFVEEAQKGSDVAIGRAFDNIRSRSEYSSMRQLLLLKIVTRAFVSSRIPLTLEDILRHTTVEIGRNGNNREPERAAFAFSANYGPRYRYNPAEVHSTVVCLAGVSPPICRQTTEGTYEIGSEVVRQYFEYHLPPTEPRIPPLWIDTDNCSVLVCHLESVKYTPMRFTSCNVAKHKRGEYAKWHRTNPQIGRQTRQSETCTAVLKLLLTLLALAAGLSYRFWMM